VAPGKEGAVTSASGFVFVLDEELSEGNLVAVTATTPSGKAIRVWSEVEIKERTLILRQFFVEGAVGWAVLRGLAYAALEAFDVDCIRIEEARRISGANPGRTVRLIEFRRKAR
jgi:hypothetical protein